ncbi:MAG: HEAT repeat domain-containing protein [Acidobacteriota bacterium]
MHVRGVVGSCCVLLLVMGAEVQGAHAQDAVAPAATTQTTPAKVQQPAANERRPLDQSATPGGQRVAAVPVENVAQQTQPANPGGFDPKELRAWSMLKEAAAEGKGNTERIQAMAALGTMGNDATAAKLIEDGMRAKSGEVRSAAILAAGQTHNPALKPRLEAALDDDDAQVAYSAAVTLWRMGDEAGEDLIEAVAVGDKKVKPGLIKSSKHKAEKELHDPKALAMLAVNNASGYFLGPFGVGLKAIEYVDQNKGAGPRAAAVDQMAERHSEDVRAVMVDLLDDKEPAVRAAAAKGLGHWPGKATAQALESAMKDDKLPVRLTAAAAYIKVSDNIASVPDCRCAEQ